MAKNSLRAASLQTNKRNPSPPAKEIMAKIIPIHGLTSSNQSQPLRQIESKILNLKVPFTKILENPKFDLALGGNLVNASALSILRTPEELADFENKKGCYLIFSSLPKKRIFNFSKDGPKSFDNPIEKDGKDFYLLYIGKSDNLAGRLREHLFNSHTREKVLQGIKTGNKPKRLSGSGAMSLEFLTKREVAHFESVGALNQKVMRLKTFEKSIKKKNNPHLEWPSDGVYFLNGIDLRENQWKDTSFGVVILKTDHPIGPVFLEEAFVTNNFRPPLCRRIG